jgi:glycine dehydrogenase subunit 2
VHTPPEGPIFDRLATDKLALRIFEEDPALENIIIDLPEREDAISSLGQATEIEVVRHFTRLSTLNFDIDRGMYPLGSCTMKHNPRLNEAVAAMPALANCHPYWPEAHLTFQERVMDELARDLAHLSGFDHVCLLPAAGAHGELTATFMMRACHLSRGEPQKDVILIPDSAHGTNPASVSMAGMTSRQISTGPEGYLRLQDVEQHLDDRVAGLMVTNPNTLGIYERDFASIAAALHAKGAFLYVDGANLNAIMGIVKPGEVGADVLHFNLHKTFSTPHGGGGPGSGPIGFNEDLAPFAPGSGDPRSIGPMKAFRGQWGMFLRAWVYIRTLGGAGLEDVSREAVLNACYLRKALEGVLHLPYPTSTLHEVVFSDKALPNEITTQDLAKRLLDHGFHPPTAYFPIHVKGALMIEPTETEPKEEIDRFVDAVKAVVREAAEDPGTVKSAPHDTPVRRVDEVKAARTLDLRWTPPGIND